jgi:hypothetical protein
MIIKCIKVGNFLINIDKLSIFNDAEEYKTIESTYSVILYDSHISLTETAESAANIYSFMVSIRCQKIKENLKNLLKYSNYIFSQNELNTINEYRENKNDIRELPFNGVNSFYRDTNKNMINNTDICTENIINAADSVIWLIRKQQSISIEEVDPNKLIKDIAQMLAIHNICESKHMLKCDIFLLKAAIVDIILFCNIKNIYVSSEELDHALEAVDAKVSIDLYGEFCIKDIAAIAICCTELERCGFFIYFGENTIKVAKII